MPISGLVLQFDSDDELMQQSINQMRTHERIEVGIQSQSRAAVVVDSLDEIQDHQLMQWLASLPGVASVQITFIGFDESETA